MLGEIVIFAMLKDEDPSFVEIVAIQNEVWNLRQLLQGVWRIGKDKVKLLLAGLQKTEYITTNQNIFVFAQLLKTLAYEVGMIAVGLYADNPLQPRDTSSSEMLPVPAKRSRAEVSSKSIYPCSTLKMFSFAKSVVGRALNERGMSKWRPLYCPVMILIFTLNFEC